MRYSALRTFPPLLATIVLFWGGLVVAANLDSVRGEIAAMRYTGAEAELVEIAKSSKGDEKQEALYLLAGLKTSASEAEIIYNEVIRIEPSSRWGAASQLELAKIRYGLGQYARAFEILAGCSACRRSDEACYFQGLCAVVLKRYDEAKGSLARVKSDRYRTWVTIALADVEAGLNNKAEACRRYRSLARSAASPTAMYRYGECLEEEGDIDGAVEVFEEVSDRFEQTPEALLAAEKLEALRLVLSRPVDSAREPPRGSAEVEEMPRLASGFTLQFGSFQDRANAIKLAAQLKRDLPGVRIDSELLNFKEVHRVRFGYFKTRVEAQRRVDEITKLTGEPCTIMPLP